MPNNVREMTNEEIEAARENIKEGLLYIEAAGYGQIFKAQLDALDALCAAARQHPERQAALEEVLSTVKNYRDTFEAAEGCITTDVVNAEERLDKLIRSLEGK